MSIQIQDSKQNLIPVQTIQFAGGEDISKFRQKF